MTYNVGDKISLEYLNTNKDGTPSPVRERVMSLPSKLIPGTKVSFLAMAHGLIVMSVIEPPMTLNVVTG